MLPWLKTGAGHRPASCECKRAAFELQRGVGRGGKLLNKHAVARPERAGPAGAAGAPRPRPSGRGFLVVIAVERRWRSSANGPCRGACGCAWCRWRCSARRRRSARQLHRHRPLDQVARYRQARRVRPFSHPLPLRIGAGQGVDHGRRATAPPHWRGSRRGVAGGGAPGAQSQPDPAGRRSRRGVAGGGAPAVTLRAAARRYAAASRAKDATVLRQPSSVSPPSSRSAASRSRRSQSAASARPSSIGRAASTLSNFAPPRARVSA